MARDMKVLQFLPSIVVSFEESVSVNPGVVVFESGAYKRAETTVRTQEMSLSPPRELMGTIYPTSKSGSCEFAGVASHSSDSV